MLRYNILCRQAKAGGGIPGGVAQLGERLTGSQEVMGSIPTVSTMGKKACFHQETSLFCLALACRLEFVHPPARHYGAQIAFAEYIISDTDLIIRLPGAAQPDFAIGMRSAFCDDVVQGAVVDLLLYSDIEGVREKRSMDAKCNSCGQ